MKKDKLDVKIGTKKELIWERVRKEAAYLIQQSEDNLEIQREILKLAEDKILLEKNK